MKAYPERCRRVQHLLQDRGVDYLAVGPSSDMLYLTGHRTHITERLTLFVLPQQGEPVMIVPRLEEPLARPAATFFALHAWDEGEDPAQVIAHLLGPLADGATIAIGDRLWALHLLRLQAVFPQARFVSASPIMRDLRMVKDSNEINTMRAAAAIVDTALTNMIQRPFAGRSERAIAAELTDLMTAGGLDHVEFVIVASGPNSASPHHVVSDRVVQPGDMVVLDIGGTYHDYYADLTRTVCVGEPMEEMRRVYDVVRQAQQAGVAVVRPGTPCQEVDRATRRLITEAGYGAFFVHRTGHGIGLDGHEDPYIVEGNDQPLLPGMAFSVEPGIYVPGRFGVRIEDIVICTEQGAERLNRASRDLAVVS